jgi:hypothetical protein
MDHNDLKHYGYLFKTDKIITNGYHRFYHKELVEYKHKTIGMIEIGIDSFKSLDMWKQYFPKAFIYGLDINIEYKDERMYIVKEDQSNLDSLKYFKTQISHPIYFINDDGSHIPEHQLLSFDYLFSNVLKDGGTYIIEDIKVSYWKRGVSYNYPVNYGYEHPNSIIEQFKLVLDYVNSYYINDEDKQKLHEKTSFLSKETKDKILSITFAQNCIIIKKKGLNDLHYCKPPYQFIHNS